MTTAQKDCTGVFCGDRGRLVSEFCDQEPWLARELTSVRQLLHSAREHNHEAGRQQARAPRCADVDAEVRRRPAPDR